MLVLLGAALLSMLSLGHRQSARADDAALDAEYQRRFQAIAADDLPGHVEIAKWARSAGAWPQLEKEANHILSLDSNHQLAKLMLDLAKTRLAEQQNAGGSPAPSASPNASGGSSNAGKDKTPKPKPLTDAQVQTLRRKELRPLAAEHVGISFQNNVLDRFWNYLAEREGLKPSDRSEFSKKTQLEKALFMVDRIHKWELDTSTDDQFNDIFSSDIIIQNDPLLFKEFKIGTEKILLSGCATAKCHGGDDAVGFRMFNEGSMTDGMHYANYLQLMNYEAKDGKLISRLQPERSLVLRYGMAVKGAASEHPGKVEPLFRAPTDTKYVTILRWASALGPNEPDYDVDLEFEE
jgi:hypothetical protein